MKDPYFVLVGEVIKTCFLPIKKTRWTNPAVIEREIKIRRAFLDSPLVKMFCDCSDNFEIGKLKKRFNDFIKPLTKYK